LRSGERLYVNGAVLRAQQKTTIELLNDAHFLLEAHVLQPEEAVTPLRQLYFALQTVLMEPTNETAAKTCTDMWIATLRTFSTNDVVVGLRVVGDLIQEGRIFDAMKTVRGLLPVEERILKPGKSAGSKAA
jgi:flagellar protein FlbT